MGDNKRFWLLTRHIIDLYSPPLKIADVAGGRHGHLNRCLTLVGFDVTTIDPIFDPRRPCRVGEKEWVDLQGIATKYHADMATDYDLIVGMHSDGATEELAYSALKRPTIIVPCCNHWDGRLVDPIRGRINETLRKCFEELGIPYEEGRLEITGQNRIYTTQPPTIEHLLPQTQPYQHSSGHYTTERSCHS